MQYPTSKNSLNQQTRPVIQYKHLKNHDRILYISGLFTPPKTQEDTVGMAKETEEWRSLFTMVLIAGFGAVMLLISVIGSYGILATSRLEAHEQQLRLKLDSMRQEKSLMQEEITALKTNPEYIELIARKELGLVHSSELIYYLPESADRP
ncbi:MAG: septum formation initiator family protein [SAR324 cluster bacterium]|nr:septum formation initiator family protein [SAR324 cluster bacterium]MBL7035764.1 septum formation initiator family protein [SAR324 cluster bacterium]